MECPKKKKRERERREISCPRGTQREYANKILNPSTILQRISLFFFFKTNKINTSPVQSEKILND